MHASMFVHTYVLHYIQPSMTYPPLWGGLLILNNQLCEQNFFSEENTLPLAELHEPGRGIFIFFLQNCVFWVAGGRSHQEIWAGRVTS
jgi:hypothetical protein